VQSIYLSHILKNYPRVLTQIDRDPDSRTYGCCDRNFWHLKIRDFSSAILQQCGLVTVLLYQLDFSGNPCYKNNNLFEWSKATLDFWVKIQLPDGSFNEYYPNEHGYPPTAFSLFSACGIYQRLGMTDRKIESAISKTANYLIKNVEEQALNQEMAAITAIYYAGIVLKNPQFVDCSRHRFKRFLSLQSTEGWFSEYGGADLGYLSVTLDMMAEYYYFSEDISIKEPISSIIEFMSYFVHQDGTIGGEYGSRNTTYCLPNGIEVAAQLGIKKASYIRKALFSDSSEFSDFISSIDDRYISHYVLHSFLRALEREKVFKGNYKKEDSVLDSTCYFPESKLLSFKNPTYSAIVGFGKGGVIKAFTGNKETFLNCGYRIPIRKDVCGVTNWQDPLYKVEWDGKVGRVSGKINLISLKVPTPFLHFGLRITAAILGKHIIGYLKKILIFRRKESDILFTREINLEDTKIIITDYIQSPSKITVKRAVNASLRHVASGKFFMTSDLLSKSDVIAKNINRLYINTEIDMKDGFIKETVNENA